MQTTIFSFNLNGVRNALKRGLAEWLKMASPDILCIQELKADENAVDKLVFEYLGYTCYLHPSEKKGYSGVMTLCKNKPLNYVIGMGNKKYDIEGRVLRTDFPEFTLINVYIPSGTTGEIRQQYKMEFLADFSAYINELKKEKQKILVCGDYNICHKPIDINHPERHLKSSGFLPEERAWFNTFLEEGMVDTFRLFNDSPEQYTWWSFRANARAKNLGWRIDYHIVSEALRANTRKAAILNEVQFSDHCPVSVTLEF